MHSLLFLCRCSLGNSAFLKCFCLVKLKEMQIKSPHEVHLLSMTSLQMTLSCFTKGLSVSKSFHSSHGLIKLAHLVCIYFYFYLIMERYLHQSKVSFLHLDCLFMSFQNIFLISQASHLKFKEDFVF